MNAPLEHYEAGGLACWKILAGAVVIATVYCSDDATDAEVADEWRARTVSHGYNAPEHVRAERYRGELAQEAA
ncbi:hypothetical protein [Luteimonas saliphila]|uniref:hypothetical protein n=1 Tax=Luteimonas saliphila TaxID=2804919 RepID=UPI00192DF33B|nr:hypothetical protein [Luteimonas saliphila]